MRLFVGLVAVATGSLVAYGIGADTTVAALLLLVAVVGAAMFGWQSGVVAALLGAVALNLWFVEPRSGLSVGNLDDVVGLVVFTLIALVVATLVGRERSARRQANLGEQEARLRVEITDLLLRGQPTDLVVATTAEAITDMFGLCSCTLTTAGTTISTDRPQRRAGRVVTVRTDEAVVEAVTSVEEPLTSAGEDVLAALTSSLGLLFERTELQRQADDARVDAEVNRARAAFFAAAGHNLRTPLTSVGAAVSTLLDQRDALDASSEQELLEMIRDETSRLSRMVSKVLSQSLVRSSDLVPELEPVDLEGMVQVAVRRLGPTASGHDLVLDVPADLGQLSADVTMLEQILLNLLENAVRFAPPGSPITIAARRVDDDVLLRVVDHGPGVVEADRASIFDEFQRSGTSTESEGAGLGLAIVRAMVDAHGGSTWCEETPGGGATFVVRLPLDEARS